MHSAPNDGRLLSPDKRLEQVDRIVSSPVLQHSQTLCNLLKFLSRHSVEHPDTSVREHQIATAVFGRAPDFDPRLDSTVRVHMGRLRAKLADYYSSVGRDEPIVVEIPKGSHTVTFREREPLRAAPAALPVALPIPKAEPASATAIPFWRRWVVFAAVAVLAAAALLLASRPGEHAPAAASVASDPLSLFWRGVLQSHEEPLVVFSNAEFVGRPETGLRYYRPGHDPAETVFDHYTGVGEVIAVHELDQVFERIGRPIQLKRGRLLNWDDTKNRDVVFLGSPSENLSLRELSLAREFKFETMTDGPRKGDLAIVNVHPEPGEPSLALGSRELPITEDYALVEVAPGPAKSQSILMLAGTTTFGTQGAVEFMCDPAHVRDLLPRVRAATGVAPFSALLRIKVNRGVPVEGELVALRRRS
jgi:hypothetical protein